MQEFSSHVQVQQRFQDILIFEMRILNSRDIILGCSLTNKFLRLITEDLELFSICSSATSIQSFATVNGLGRSMISKCYDMKKN